MIIIWYKLKETWNGFIIVLIILSIFIIFFLYNIIFNYNKNLFLIFDIINYIGYLLISLFWQNVLFIIKLILLWILLNILNIKKIIINNIVYEKKKEINNLLYLEENKNKLLYTEKKNIYEFFFKSKLYDLRKCIDNEMYKNDKFSYCFFKKYIEFSNDYEKENDDYFKIMLQIIEDEKRLRNNGSELSDNSKLYNYSYKIIKKFNLLEEKKKSTFFEYKDLISINKRKLRIYEKKIIKLVKGLSFNSIKFKQFILLNAYKKKLFYELCKNRRHIKDNIAFYKFKEKECKQMFNYTKSFILKIEKNFDIYLKNSNFNDREKEILNELTIFYLKISWNNSIISENNLYILNELLKELETNKIPLNIDEDGWWKSSLKLVRNNNIRKKIKKYENNIKEIKGKYESNIDYSYSAWKKGLIKKEYKIDDSNFYVKKIKEKLIKRIEDKYKKMLKKYK